MNNPKLSIIIATFNAAKTLSVSLDSVLNQTFQDWECIIIDGASKDNTIEIVKSYVERDSRFRYISEPDKGIYDAFNKGWKMAKGEWIYYLGADDEVLPKAFELLFLSDLGISEIVYGNVVYKTSKGQLSKKSEPKFDLIRKHMLCSHQAMLMKRELIAKMGGFNLKYKVSADFDLILRSYLHSKAFKYIDLNMAVFDCTGVSSGIESAKDAYNLRKDNSSIPHILNLLIYCKSVIKLFIKRIFRK